MLYLSAPKEELAKAGIYPANIQKLPQPPTPVIPCDLPAEEPWKRIRHEPLISFNRFQMYLLLGPRRTLNRLATKLGIPKARGSYYRQAERWRWQERAELWDDENGRLEQERKEEIMRTGFSLDYERVAALKEIAIVEGRIAADLAATIQADPKTARNQKLTFSYEAWKKQFASTLDDIAKETGGRVRRINIHAELESYAIGFAQEQGYDLEQARSIAKMIELEAKTS